MFPHPIVSLLVPVLALAVSPAAGQTLEYSTYFPGWDNTYRIAVDAAGDIYQTGFENKIPGVKNSGRGAYVAKLTPSGSGNNDLDWITFVAPGSNHTRFLGLTLDGAGKVYAIVKVPAGGQKDDLTVMRFSSTDGQQEMSHVIGQGAALAIAVHDNGSDHFVYATGSTEDPLFPTNTGPPHGGQSDAFVVKYKVIEGPSPSLMLVKGRFLGGSSGGSDIVVNGMGHAYLVGGTSSPNFPTQGAFQVALGGGSDAFVTVLDPALVITYSTFLGGTEDDGGREIAVDGAGQVYVTGITRSSNFPKTSGAFDETFNLEIDVYVAKLDPSESGAASLVAATFLGGSDRDLFSSFGVNSSGVFVAAGTFSNDFPTTAGAMFSGPLGNQDTVLARLSLDLKTLLNSTYFGGSARDTSPRVAVGTAGTMYVTGFTGSSDFPVTSGAFAEAKPTQSQPDSFISKLSFAPPTAGIAVSPTAGLVTTEGGGTDEFTVVLHTEPTDDVTIGISSSNTAEGTVSTSSLTFTLANWNTPQTVTVTGVDDGDIDGDIPYTLVTAPAVSSDPAYSGLDPADVAATNLDDESAPGITVGGINPASMGAGGSIGVTITGSGFAAGASVTFENGTGPSPTATIISVTATTITATVSVSNGGPKRPRLWDVRVTNTDSSTGVLVDGFTVIK